MNNNTVILSLENPTFSTYLIVSSLLVLKMMGLIVLTIYHRITKKIFISEEDTAMSGGTVGSDQDIDRVKRALQNDLENIPAFLAISLAYLWVPVPDWAVHILYYAFLILRSLHSFVYAVYVIPQPTRALCFVLSFAILGYMCSHVFVYAFSVGYFAK
ncbi:microsomal glutathione S-transferase 1-like [Sitophilus oryzae]|uniref:Microsomal glutathione S-transferase 1 n=1 Tax=Sitophilus oryzae TaxID=7048 RepID=A0A6J2XS42_SITOR|nr:microsomal glutathione S-transferase 1-like [Sitophilus oryzae]